VIETSARTGLGIDQWCGWLSDIHRSFHAITN